MLKNLAYNLLLVASLFLFSARIQVVASDKSEEITSTFIQVLEKISINKASIEKSSAINDIRTQKAQAIIEYREIHGDFVSIEELVKVKGIGEYITKNSPLCFALMWEIYIGLLSERYTREAFMLKFILMDIDLPKEMRPQSRL